MRWWRYAKFLVSFLAHPRTFRVTTVEPRYREVPYNENLGITKLFFGIFVVI